MNGESLSKKGKPPSLRGTNYSQQLSCHLAGEWLCQTVSSSEHLRLFCRQFERNVVNFCQVNYCQKLIRAEVHFQGYSNEILARVQIVRKTSHVKLHPTRNPKEGVRRLTSLRIPVVSVEEFSNIKKTPQKLIGGRTHPATCTVPDFRCVNRTCWGGRGRRIMKNDLCNREFLGMVL